MERVLGVIERVNFGVTQLYNIAIVGTVDDIINLKSWMVANRGSSTEVGYFNWNDGSSSGKSDINCLCIKLICLMYILYCTVVRSYTTL